MEQTVFMGRGNSKAEFLGFGRRRQAAVTDCDISLPDVRSTEIIRARELTALVYAARLSRTRTRLPNSLLNSPIRVPSPFNSHRFGSGNGAPPDFTAELSARRQHGKAEKGLVDKSTQRCDFG